MASADNDELLQTIVRDLANAKDAAVKAEAELRHLQLKFAHLEGWVKYLVRTRPVVWEYAKPAPPSYLPENAPDYKSFEAQQQ